MTQLEAAAFYWILGSRWKQDLLTPLKHILGFYRRCNTESFSVVKLYFFSDKVDHSGVSLLVQLPVSPGR